MVSDITTAVGEYHSEMDQFYTEIEVDGDTIRVPFIRQSERKAFKSCQYQWDWSWNKGFTPATEKQDARWFGTGIHLALAEWYIKGKKRGRNPIETFEEFCGDAYAKVATGPYFKPDEWHDAKALGVEMLTNYLAEFGDDQEWEIISTEQRYRMKLRDENKNVVGILVGTFDAVLRHTPTNKIWMLDHKTARDRITTNHLVKDEQAGTYVAVGESVLRRQGLIGPDEVVHGIIYNFLRKAKADTRPKNRRGAYCNKPVKADYVREIGLYAKNAGSIDPMFREAALTKMKISELESLANSLRIEVLGEESKVQPPPLFAREFVVRNRYEKKRQVGRIREEVKAMTAVRSGGLPLLKSPSDHCGWCDFKDICDIDEQGGDVEDFAKAAFKVRDPYADHREGAVNSKTSVKADTANKKKARAF